MLRPTTRLILALVLLWGLLPVQAVAEACAGARGLFLGAGCCAGLASAPGSCCCLDEAESSSCCPSAPSAPQGQGSECACLAPTPHADPPLALAAAPVWELAIALADPPAAVWTIHGLAAPSVPADIPRDRSPPGFLSVPPRAPPVD